MAETNNIKKPIKKIFTGVVVSDKMTKTIVVRVDSMRPHFKYPKLISRSNKFKVHDEKNSAKIGDKVKIIETRPLSKEKRWRLLEILGKGSVEQPGAKND